jgi:ribosomal protein S12 methylthiotransferase
VLVDGPSEDPAFAWEGRTAAQAPEIDGVVYLRARGLRPGQRLRVEIVEADGYDLVGVPVHA